MIGMVELVARDCDAVSRLLASVSDDDLERPTRLLPWSVVEVVAHLHRDFERLLLALDATAPPGPVDCDEVTYWRAYDPDANAKRTQERVRQVVGHHSSARDVVRAFDEMWARAVSRLAEADDTRLVATWEPVMTLGDFAATRLVEIVVHGLDITDALLVPPVATPDGLRYVVRVLRALLAAEPPTLAWDDVTWIDKACGRVPLTPAERDRLGSLAGRFPVLR